MIIYIDIYLIKNVIFNFLLIYLTSLLIRKKVKLYKVILASGIGGIYAVCALCSNEIFTSVFLKILTSVIMLIISFGFREVKNMLSSFFVVTYLVAGITTSILNVNNYIILLFFAITMVWIFYMYIKHQKHQKVYEMKLRVLSKEFEVIAKLDTGNELRDGLFGAPVIVLSEECARRELTEELIKILNNEKLEIPNEYKNKIKLISFETISGDGVKIGVKLDEVIIYEKDKDFVCKAVMILTERKFKGFDVLIGRNLLDGGIENENIGFNKIENGRIV